MFKYFFLITAFFVLSCSTNNEDFQPLNKYRLYKGLASAFKVEETKIVNNVSTKTTYYISEVIGDSLNINNGVSYVLERYRRSENGFIAKLSNWQIRQNIFSLTRYEDNREFIALAYPIIQYQKWLPYPLEESVTQVEAFYENLNSTFELNGIKYNNTYKVIYNEKPNNLVDYISNYAVYSGSKGLIYSESIYYEYSQEPDKIGKGYILNGSIIKKSYLEPVTPTK